MAQYNGEHSVTFINKDGAQINSWGDWLLIPSSRPIISTPPVQEFNLEITGRSGKIDFQDNIFKEPVFNNRTGSLEFVVDHENDKYISWHHTYNQILQFLHGRWLKIILNDEPDYYYEGRFTLNEFKSNSDWSTITIDYDLKPFKLSVVDTMSEWLWDPFSFITGYIRSASDFEVTLNSAQGTVPVHIDQMIGDSEIEISSNNANAWYFVRCKNPAGYERHYDGKSTDVLKFTMSSAYPDFTIQLNSPSLTQVKFYVKFIGGRL